MTIHCEKCGGELSITDAGGEGAARARGGLAALPSLRIKCQHCKRMTPVRPEGAAAPPAQSSLPSLGPLMITSSGGGGAVLATPASRPLGLAGAGLQPAMARRSSSPPQGTLPAVAEAPAWEAAPAAPRALTSPWSTPSAAPAPAPAAAIAALAPTVASADRRRAARALDHTIPLDADELEAVAPGLAAAGRRALTSASGTFEAVAQSSAAAVHAAARAAARALDGSAVIDVRTMAEQTLSAQQARQREASGTFARSALFRSLVQLPEVRMVGPMRMQHLGGRALPGWLWATLGGSMALVFSTLFLGVLVWHNASQAERSSPRSLMQVAQLTGLLDRMAQNLPGGVQRASLLGAASAAPAVAAAAPMLAPAPGAMTPTTSATSPGLAAAPSPGAPPPPASLASAAAPLPAAAPSTVPSTVVDAAEGPAAPARASASHRKHAGPTKGGVSRHAAHLSKRSLVASRAVASAAATTPARRAAARPGRSSLSREDAELLALLDSTRSAARPAAPVRPAAAPPAPRPAQAALSSLPAHPDRADVTAGLRAAQGGVAQCFERYQVPGTAHVRLTIASSGAVDSADVSGPLAQTPSGECVSRAVKKARFKPFRDETYSITYPFLLR